MGCTKESLLLLSSSRSSVLFHYTPYRNNFCSLLCEKMPLFIEKIYFENSKWFDELLPKIDDFFYPRVFFPEN